MTRIKDLYGTAGSRALSKPAETCFFQQPLQPAAPVLRLDYINIQTALSFGGPFIRWLTELGDLVPSVASVSALRMGRTHSWFDQARPRLTNNLARAKSVCDNICRPYGTRMYFPRDPGLKSWAKIFHPCGAEVVAIRITFAHQTELSHTLDRAFQIAPNPFNE